VIGFYCISGYLITRISLTIYSQRPRAFLSNRFLRIYPQYIAAVLFAVFVVLIQPAAAFRLHSAMRIPTDAIEWINQIIIFGLYGAPLRLLPAAWSLNVELFFYIIIGIFTHRSEKATYFMLGLSLVPAAFGLFRFLPDYLCWTSLPVCFFGSPYSNAYVFFLGSAAFFLSRRLTIPQRLPLLMLCIYVICAFLGSILIDDGIYIDSLLVVSSIAVMIFLMRVPSVTTRWKMIGKFVDFLGRSSYPLFLVHWSASVWVFDLVGKDNPSLFLGGYASSLIVAMSLVVLIDRPIESIRNRIRGSNRLNAR